MGLFALIRMTSFFCMLYDNLELVITSDALTFKKCL